MATHFQVDSVYSIHFTSADIGMLFRVVTGARVYSVPVFQAPGSASQRLPPCLLDLHPVWQEPFALGGSK